MRNRKLWVEIGIIILFTVLLISFRLVWFSAPDKVSEVEISNGQLDLRGWDFSDGQTVALSGEWMFYPYELLEEASVKEDAERAVPIQVPGDWSAKLNQDDHANPYGYGTYHLRVLVDNLEELPFSLRVSSTRSASSLYANGLFIGGSGETGVNLEQSYARNVPYTSTSVRSDESGVIDLVLQVTNFVDPRSSGLVRAIKFGYEEDLVAEVQLSMLLQAITGTVFFVHAIFALIVFLVGIRDVRLIHFFIVILCLAVMSLSGGDEKLLYQYTMMDYDTVYKLSMFAMILLSWSLISCVAPQIKKFSSKFLPLYTGVCGGLIIATFLLPMDYLATADPITFGAVFFAAIVTTGVLLATRKRSNGSIWLALAIIAIINNYIWWAYTMVTGMKFVYYPVDLIIAILCLTGVWFKHYHQMHVDTKKLATRLQAADKEKDAFLANTSHELRNPLHSVLNMSEAILERERRSLQAESVRNLETVLSVSRRMSSMLDELLEMARLEDGKPQLELQAVSVQAVTGGVIDILYYQLEGKSIQIINQIPADFPLVLADENRVVQIVYNLLHNAVKYTPDGRITMKASIQQDTAYISIKDTGIGMDKESLRTVFEAYVQGSNRDKAIEGGFGLGLNISKRLIELHGGNLTAQSSVGEGSTFTFSLPLAKSVGNEVTRRAETQVTERLLTNGQEADHLLLQETEEQMNDGDRPRIIVVDDDPVNIQVVETILSRKEYSVSTALTAKEALVMLDEKEWDLIISDVMMPLMSGYELTRTIRERFTMLELPILLLTARDSTRDIENGFASGANDYVTKPLDAAELRARVNALTEVKRSSRERLQMEAAWLQAQIKPHFLFNTLNSIRALSEFDMERMQKLLESFSELLRGKFNFQNMNELVPIESELNLIRAYLHIEKERFGDRLCVEWEVTEGVVCDIPTLSIQPLVENAIEHGIMTRIDGGKVTIRVIDNGEYIKVTIVDNGVGMEVPILGEMFEEPPGGVHGVGLLNTHLRLKRLFGKGLQVTSEIGSGVIVSFEVPKKR